MIIVLRSGTSDADVADVERRIRAMGYTPHTIRVELRNVIGAIGDDRGKDRLRALESLECVEAVTPILQPFKLASREVRSANSQVRVGDTVIGGRTIVVMAGPCSVESRTQLFTVAELVAKAGARVLRGGAFKPRSSPYSFQGMGEEGLKLLREAGDHFNLLVISEVMEISQIPLMLPYVDILQVGARNMQNFNLLRELGKVKKPVLLKRGIAATLEELLLSAEYIMAGGNYDVILCERGIRTFETYTRNTLDISAIPIIKKLSHLPMTSDPSHGTGRRDKVAPMARASVAAGADALLIEVHHDPDRALSDGAQSLFPEQFRTLMDELRMIAPAVHRKIA